MQKKHQKNSTTATKRYPKKTEKTSISIKRKNAYNENANFQTLPKRKPRKNATYLNTRKKNLN